MTINYKYDLIEYVQLFKVESTDLQSVIFITYRF